MAKQAVAEPKLKIASELKVDRRTVAKKTSERRSTSDRRVEDAEFDGEENRKQPTPRRKVERRRQIDPTTCERDYSTDEIAFMRAMDLYKRKSGRQFPTWSEVLEVIHSLGYRQVAEPTEIYPQGN